MRFIAVDPGLATGIAEWSGHTQTKPITHTLDVPQFYDWLLHEVVRSFISTHIICEAYVISERTMKASRQAWSLEHIGALKFIAHVRGLDLTLQQASAAKRFATNERLRETGWYTPGRDHENDALRHLLLYAVKARIITL